MADGAIKRGRRLLEPTSTLMHDGGGVYMRRWYSRWLHDKGWPSGHLHCFHTSDGDVPHDHPWHFVAITLWGWWRAREQRFETGRQRIVPMPRRALGIVRLYRATTIHRIEVTGRVWTIIVHGPRIRDWGFWRIGEGFIPFANYRRRMGFDGHEGR